MTSRIDKAMVLAAGLGTRMAPASGTLPKPLVRLGGTPLIDRVLDRIAGAGIATAVVNVHHKADQIEAHLKGRTRPRIATASIRGASGPMPDARRWSCCAIPSASPSPSSAPSC